jgi:hypothetical protein
LGWREGGDLEIRVREAEVQEEVGDGCGAVIETVTFIRSITLFGGGFSDQFYEREIELLFWIQDVQEGSGIVIKVSWDRHFGLKGNT